MENDQMSERSVWNFGNYLRTALFLLFACAILSHDRTDLALLEGGIGGPALYRNWIGFLGAHTARMMFYTFGLATYPFLLILFLMLIRRFIPGLPRRGTLWWALPVILLGSSMLFAMLTQQFIAETDHLGIGRMEQSSLALSGGVVGSWLAAPQTGAALPDAGFIRRYIGDVGTILVALAFLLPGLVFLFIRDWLPLLVIAFKADPEPQKPAEGEEEEPVAASPAIHHFSDGEDGYEDEEPTVAPPQSKFKTALGVLFRGKQPAPVANDDDSFDDRPIAAPPGRGAPAQKRQPSTVIHDPDTVVAPPPRRTGQPAPGGVIRDPDELVMPAPRPQRQTQSAPVQAVPQAAPEPYIEPEDDDPAALEANAAAAEPEEDDFDLTSGPDYEQDDEPEVEAAPPRATAAKPAAAQPPRAIPTQSYSANKAGYDREPPPPPDFNETPPPPPPVYEEYHLPSTMLLDRHGDQIAEEDQAYIREASQSLEKTLESFGVNGFVSNITVGPRVTQFEISLSPGVRVEKARASSAQTRGFHTQLDEGPETP